MTNEARKNQYARNRARRKLRKAQLAATTDRAIRDIVGIEKPSILSIRRAVAASFELREDDWFFRSRKPLPVAARNVAMAAARKLTKKSYPVIARYFGRQHYTVERAVTRYGQQIEQAKQAA